MKIKYLYVFGVGLLGSLLLFSFVTLASSPANNFSPPPNNNDLKISFTTKDIPGARVFLTARIHAPIEAVWKAVLDFNQQATIYPRIKQAFCIKPENIQKIQNSGINHATEIGQMFYDDRCEPEKSREKGKVWQTHLFQEFDYPFPLTNRWIIANVNEDESKYGQGALTETAHLVIGNQKVYQVIFQLKQDPNRIDETLFSADIWSDPGGIIMGWMMKLTVNHILPKYVEIIEQESIKHKLASKAP